MHFHDRMAHLLFIFLSKEGAPKRKYYYTFNLKNIRDLEIRSFCLVGLLYFI